MRRVARSEYSLIRLRICPSVCLKHDPDQTEKDMGKEIPRVSLSNKQKKIKYSMGKCIYQILGLYRFLFVQGSDTTHRRTNMQPNLGILATGYSPHVNLKE